MEFSYINPVLVDVLKDLRALFQWPETYSPLGDVNFAVLVNKMLFTDKAVYGGGFCSLSI